MKQDVLYRDCYHYAVAPHVGAWVETKIFQIWAIKVKSPPTWGRGFKHFKTAKWKVLPSRPPRGGVG